MTPPPVADPESRRLEALQLYRLLDTEAEQEFDDLTWLAAELCQTPIALISLIDAGRQWFKSRTGAWSFTELSREVTFCSYAIQHDDVMVVEDALADPRFRDHPLVKGAPGLRFYAGAPLLTPEGHAIGTLCVFDFQPRTLDARQLRSLAILSRQVMAHLELRRQRVPVDNSEVQLLAAFHACPVGMAIYRCHDGNLVDINAAFSRLSGWSRDEMHGHTTIDLGLVDETGGPQLPVHSGPHEPVHDRECILRTHDSQQRHVLLSTEAIKLRGEPLAIATVVDITDRKMSEQAVRRADERVRQLNRVYAVLSEINENILRRQQDLPSMLRAACEIAVSRGRFEMAWAGVRGNVDEPALRVAAHAGASPDTLEILRTLISQGATGCQMTFRALQEAEHGVCNDIRSDPRAASWRDAALGRGYESMASFPLKLRGTVAGTFNLYAREPGFFDAEELRLLDELALDLSFGLELHEREFERRAVEHALRKSEERFREIAENIQEVFWMSDPQTRRLLYVSPAFEKVWGRSCASLYESPQLWLEVVHAEDRDLVARSSEEMYTSGDYAVQYRIVRPDGAVRWIRDRAFPVRGADGEVLHFVGIAEDITEQRVLEEQLRQAQKLEAIGQLAGGVAHDFNNILTIIRGFGALLLLSKLPADALEATQAIIDAAERAANLTRQLLAFGRRQVMQPRNLDLNQIIVGLTPMLQRIVGEDVPIRLDLHRGSLMTRVDAGMLDQVLLNLVVNARDAMPTGGELRIETFNEGPQRRVGLRVIDRGVGIPREHLAHIFEPFFTTKGPGKGTGLGLATVYGIVSQHHGSVEVRSTLGMGTTIEVLLPAADGAAQVAEPSAVLNVEARGEETILVVEDDLQVRSLMRRILEQQGYRVLEAAHGPEALQLWEREGAGVDLVLTDMVMPEGMSGVELARRLREKRPTLKVILMSGYSPETAGRELSERERKHYIQKPVAPAVVVATVRRCLDETDGDRAPAEGDARVGADPA